MIFPALAAMMAGFFTAPLQAALPTGTTVFIVLEENKDWFEITDSYEAPYIVNTLLRGGGHAKRYYNPPKNHPSEPNYIWLEAGGNLGLTTDADPSASNSSDSPDHLVHYLDSAGISWRAYAEGILGDVCPLHSQGQYAPKHVPFVFFNDVTNNRDPASAYCISHIRPYSELAVDLKNNTMARYNFIVPNLCHDMHDCGISTGDRWLSQEVPPILKSQAFTRGAILFITWDEGDGSDGPIGMIVLSNSAKARYSNSVHYTHSSTLKTMQELFGVGPLLRDAANVKTADLSDFFGAPGSYKKDPPPSPAGTPASAKAYPNPFQPAQGQRFVTVSGLPAQAQIRIYTTAGELVKNLTSNFAGVAHWDATNEAGKGVASGVYFVFIQGAEESTTIKIAVQR